MEKQKGHIKVYEKAVKRVKGNKAPLLLFGLSASGKSKIIEYAAGRESIASYWSDKITDKQIVHKVISLIVEHAGDSETLVITFVNHDLAIRVKKLTGLDLISLGEDRPTNEIRTLAFLKRE